jgi:hypothetical protein
MKANKRLNKAILEVVENQLRDLDPPETKETFDRLIEEGYSEEQARTLIGFVVASELFDILKYRTPYNNERYVKALRRLPELPVDEEE